MDALEVEGPSLSARVMKGSVSEAVTVNGAVTGRVNVAVASGRRGLHLPLVQTSALMRPTRWG